MKGKKVYSWKKKLKLLEQNIKKIKLRKKRVYEKFHGSLKALFKKKKKFNSTQINLENTAFIKFSEKSFTPLLKYIANLIKARLLRTIKYFNNKKVKTFKGPKPKLFSKFDKRVHSKIFYFSFFGEFKNQSLYFVFLKRFFKWYFLLTNKEMSLLKKFILFKKTSFFDFISIFERRVLNIVLRSGMSPNPIVSRFLFSLNCVNSTIGIIKNPSSILKPGLSVFLNISFIPYSLYRYYINYWRASYIIKEYTVFEQYKKTSLSKIRDWQSLVKLIMARRVKHYRNMWMRNLNWSWKFLQIFPKAASCCLVRLPLKEDFSGFITRSNLLFYRRLFQLS